MDRDSAVAELFAAHAGRLVGLARLLLGGGPESEEVVQEAFVHLYAGWSRIHDPDRAAQYLVRSVVNGVRSAQRRRRLSDRQVARVAAWPEGDALSAEDAALAGAESSVVLAALVALPRRQREALVLRFYLDLSEARTAELMGCAPGTVKTHTARGLASLLALAESVH